MLEESARHSPSEGSDKDVEARQVDAEICQVDQVDQTGELSDAEEDFAITFMKS